MAEPLSQHYHWQGRVDVDEPAALALRVHQRIRPLNLAAPGQELPGVALLGFCYDQGVRINQGRIGAGEGPDKLRDLLANLPWRPERALYDAGNLTPGTAAVEQAQAALADGVEALLRRGHLPFVLGGGHELGFGCWSGLMQAVGAQPQPSAAGPMPRIGIVNFDAHFDLRADTQGASSGTSFYQIAQQCERQGWPFYYCCFGVSDTANTPALFQRADAWGVEYRRDRALTQRHLEAAADQLRRFCDRCDLLYLTLCLDVLPAWVAPGVSAPAAQGVGLELLQQLLELVLDTGKVRLVDMAEYNPRFDIDQRTARVAARLFHLIATRLPATAGDAHE